ncbi:hypothetical protein NB703_001587 [Pantoea ananatis]|uniref:Uncharacterized protein n=1 Tax=Pantoea ananas TaxID=553 RepID=A0AAJ1CXK5_PANAN|nr:hypothetical protein [Pantoea ananatis]
MMNIPPTSGVVGYSHINLDTPYLSPKSHADFK